MTLVQTEPKKIIYGIPIIVNDMQGPAPDGFHVPTKDEWVALCGILTSTFWLSKNDTTMGTYLKMPTNGRRRTTSDVVDVGSGGFYWSSTPHNVDYAYCLTFSYSDIYPQNDYYRAFGFAVRCFKDAPIIPTSSWTTLYQGTGSAGIFWNSTDGLISVSGDGITWYTIMDKNLGATTVFNQGDTVNDANSGYLYQWGNNYGFAHSGTVTTSSTRVNASSYGPGNYYSSSTFITGSTDWSSAQNDNLRGGVSQGTTEKGAVKAVYLGENKVRPTFTPRTFTISRTEKSNMSSGWTYSDDAAGLTAGDTAFDEFFGYYGCRLNTSGVETAKITQGESGGAGKLDITKLGTLTSGDNVMIAFPVRGIKMTKSGSTVTLSITEELGKDGYQYYAFTKGSNIKDIMYLGAYEINSSYKSLSGATPKASATRAAFRSGVASSYNDSGRHSLITYRVMDYIKMLYMMKYGNPDSQTIVGKGYTSGSSAQTTGATNSITNATGATSTGNTGRIKLFGLEDIRGNVSEWLDCCYFNASGHLTVDNTNSVFQDSAYSTDLGQASSGYMKTIDGSTEGTFRNTSSSGASATTYYCDYSAMTANTVINAGGGYADGDNAGMFFIRANKTSQSYGYHGGRLQYL